MRQLQAYTPLSKNSNIPEHSEVKATKILIFLLFFFGILIMIGLLQEIWIAFSLGITGWTSLLFMFLQFRLLIKNGFEDAPIQAQFILSENSYRVGQTKDISLSIQGIIYQLNVSHLLIHHSSYIRSQYEVFELKWILKARQNNIKTLLFQFPVMGRFALHGVELTFSDSMNLFQTSRYIRISDWLRVLPSIPIAKINRGGRAFHLAWNQQSGVPQRQAGSGSELKDIREYQAGDSRRSIVWKHTLRHQKLLCREFESELPFSIYLLLDIGQSMREGQLGQRKLDYASEVITAFSKNVLDQRDSVGLISFDGEIYHHTKLSKGQKQFHHILQHIEELHHISQPKFTSLSLAELCKNIGEFLFQENLLANDNGRFPALPQDVIDYVWDYFLYDSQYIFPQKWDSETELLENVLRHFSEEVGIELPYRFHQWVTYKSMGMETSLNTALRHLQGGQLIIVLSDLRDITNWENILQMLKLARQRRHHVIFLSPFSPWFSQSKQTKYDTFDDEFETQELLREILTLEQWTWRKKIQKELATFGIPVLSVKPKDAPLLLMERLRRLRINNRK